MCNPTHHTQFSPTLRVKHSVSRLSCTTLINVDSAAERLVRSCSCNDKSRRTADNRGPPAQATERQNQSRDIDITATLIVATEQKTKPLLALEPPSPLVRAQEWKDRRIRRAELGTTSTCATNASTFPFLQSRPPSTSRESSSKSDAFHASSACSLTLRLKNMHLSSRCPRDLRNSLAGEEHARRSDLSAARGMRPREQLSSSQRQHTQQTDAFQVTVCFSSTFQLRSFSHPATHNPKCASRCSTKDNPNKEATLAQHFTRHARKKRSAAISASRFTEPGLAN